MKPLTSVRPFGTLAASDYRALGFKGGLEIHQQLQTAGKLFCRCPAGLYSDRYDAEILRHMRPTLSEMGEYDGTALMELKTRKNIIYRTNQKTCCTYEMDDTPPFDIDPHALDIGLRLALLLNCNLISEMHVMRKQYLDGSIPTGFQRTAIVGVEGSFTCGGRRVGIRQLAVEEDSCRQVADVGHERTYLTDRLGMPLLEIVTHPDMSTPWEMEEAGQTLRRFTRGTGLVRTGIGAARQDVNVSVRGGTRAEIKGVPRLVMIPRLTHNEAMRQVALLALRAELHRRGITKKTYRATVADVTDVVAGRTAGPAGKAANCGGRVFAVALVGFARLLAAPTQETKRFVDEFADRVRVIACLDQLPNLADHETAGRLLTGEEWRLIRRRTSARAADALVVTWGPEADARLAADEVVNRAREATVGVPSETRQALPDGTTGFERVLPGPDRMYPDTDRPPLRIPEERIARLRQDLGEPASAREDRFRAWGVPEDCIVPLVTSQWGTVFEDLVRKYDVEPRLAATTLAYKVKGWRRRGWPVEKLTANDIERTFVLYQQGAILREAIPVALARYLRDNRPLRQILNDLGRRRDAEKRLPDEITLLKRRLKRRTFRNGPTAVRAHAIGQLMASFRGLIPYAALAEAVEKAVLPAFNATRRGET